MSNYMKFLKKEIREQKIIIIYAERRIFHLEMLRRIERREMEEEKNHDK